MCVAASLVVHVVVLLLLCGGSGLVPALWASVSSCCDVDDDRVDDVNTWFDDGARPRDDSATTPHTAQQRTERAVARFR